PSSAATVTFPLLRTRYRSQKTAAADPAVNSPIRYGETPTVTTVSLQRISYH
ncbi:hypothetical protein HAX54_035753, partial [Datura stramonium]|nr:hypothetical protein [Datura stramonium]